MKTVRRRRRENKTNYLKRVKLLKSGSPRIVFRKTNKYLIIQYVASKQAQDKINFGVNSKHLIKYGWPEEFKGSLKSTPPWAARVAFNEVFGAVLICQNPGEGNRLHYHDVDEFWFIVEGVWEWLVEGKKQRVYEGSSILVKKGQKHLIKAVGKEPGIRLAITQPDVEHIYV